HPKALARFSAQTATVKAKSQAGKIKNLFDAARDQVQYSSQDFLKAAMARHPGTKIAVVLHLYYPETWPLFSRKLSLLKDHPYDLFISLPQARADFAPVVLADFPHAHIITAPNRGRDVLPFMSIAPALARAGYEYVLKMHSKKSPQRTDGGDWLTDMVDSLIPEEAAALKALAAALEDKSTGIVGPQGQYVSLPVNFKENQHYISRILTR